MKTIIINPNEAPIVKDIDNTLSSLQELVGGYIEAIYPFDDPVAIVCNEEGKINGLPLNRALYNDGEIYDVIAGTFLIVGLGEEDFEDVPEELIEKYVQLYEKPERFFLLDGELSVFYDM